MQEDAGRIGSSGTGQSWSATSLPPLRGKVGPLVRKRKAPAGNCGVPCRGDRLLLRSAGGRLSRSERRRGWASDEAL